MSRPITEQSNFITKDIDIADSNGIVALLQQCDGQIFSGYSLYNGFYDKQILDCVTEVASKTAAILEDPANNMIVMSGCGTSGRLAFAAARMYSNFLGSFGCCYRYLVAGGDRALLRSQEAPEDDYRAGVDELKKVIEGRKKVLLIGISCGLSAPYVAGQLDYSLDHPETFTTVLLGFNPVDMARKTMIPNWDKTFYNVAKRLELSGNHGYIINPVIGPEPITGSTRMKGGTATKVLLELIFSQAHLLLRERCSQTRATTINMLTCYELLWRQVCLQKESIGRVVQLAGESLLAGGHIYHVGCHKCGLVGLIDATECPPTFGSSFADVRGFIEGGYSSLGNVMGDLSDVEGYQIDLEYFRSHVIPTLSAHDLVVVAMMSGDPNSQLESVVRVAMETTCKTALVVTTTKPDQVTTASYDATVELALPMDALRALCSHADHMTECFAQLATKWVLNAVTTGAHVIQGKVASNLMIDVQVSNSKLFHRAVGIIRDVAMVTEEVAKKCLLRSIYECDQLSTKILEDTDVVNHVKRATGQKKVVPIAILLAQSSRQHHTVSTARNALAQDPIVRRVIMS